MKILINLLVLIVITGISLNAFAMEVSGTLTEATWEYIVVERNKYHVTDRTIIADKDSPKDFFPYNPKFLRHNKTVTVIIKHKEAKKILIEVPK